MPTTLVAVRHGQTDWNPIHRIQGLIDTDLNDTGIRQMEETALKLKDYAFSVIYTSTITRGYHSAEIVNRYHDVPVIRDADLGELCQGEWQGHLVSELEKSSEEYRRWQKNPMEVTPPGGVHIRDFADTVIAKIGKVLVRHFGERMALPPAASRMVEDGRLGRKSKKGFYTYDRRKKRVDHTVYSLLPRGSTRRSIARREIQDRLVLAFLNESAHCLQDVVLRSPRDGDVGAIFGLGFPPFLGGPFRHLDRMGAAAAVGQLEKLQESHGMRFEPAAILRDMAREGRSFHAA